jgi:hypothetical protein
MGRLACRGSSSGWPQRRHRSLWELPTSVPLGWSPWTHILNEKWRVIFCLCGIFVQFYIPTW